MKVLIVEDKVGRPLHKVLEKWGYEVRLAEDAEKAWEILTNESIHFFLVDWMLPGISGLELVQKIRGMARYRHTPVVMISSRTRREDILQIAQAGIDGYIAKPFTPVQLRQKIEEVLQKRKSSADERIDRILAGHEMFDPLGSHPLILLCFGAAARKDLAELEAPYFDCLFQMVSVIEALNEARPRPKLGYLLIESTHQIAQLLRRRSLRRRTRTIALASTCKGNHVLLIRMLVYRQLAGGVPFLLVCDCSEALPDEIQEVVEQEGLQVVECPLDPEQWKAHLDRYAGKNAEKE